MADVFLQIQDQVSVHVTGPRRASDVGDDMDSAIVQVEGQVQVQVLLRERPAPQLLITAGMDVLHVPPAGVEGVVKLFRRRPAQGSQILRLCLVLHFENVFVGQPHTFCRVIAVNGVPLKAVVKIGAFQHQGENLPAVEALILHAAAVGGLLFLDALQALLCNFAVGGRDFLIDVGGVGCVILNLRHMEGIPV